jgi:CheY-like chemotaxis protein
MGKNVFLLSPITYHSFMLERVGEGVYNAGHAMTENPQRVPEASPMRPTKRRILCVDDDDDTCQMLTHLLGRENYEVKTARSVSDALQIARSESFSLYILDEWFPRDAGISLCRKIREFDPHTPVVFYSGAALDSEKQEALYAGAQAFVAKPYVEELIHTVHQLLADQQTSPAL